MGEIPATVIAQLQLSPDQKVKLDAAHDARRIMWSANRKSRLAEYAGLTELLNKNAFDPREAVVLRKKTRAAMDARIDAVRQSRKLGGRYRVAGFDLWDSREGDHTSEIQN